MLVFDPHFHVWDVTDSEIASGHDGKVLSNSPVYHYTDYENDMDSLAAGGFRHVGGVYLEAMSVCFVDTKPDAMAPHYLRELAFANKELLETSTRHYVLVLAASLEASNAPTTLAALAKNPATRGIRQILNFEPNWPRNGENLLNNEAWLNGFPLLAKYNLSFDCQMNPNQFKQAAQLFAKHSNIPVIVNHFGCPLKKDLQESEQYWSGLSALAALPHVSMKLSMGFYTDQEWMNDKSQLVISTFHRLIQLFGADRCMFASNIPADDRSRVSEIYQAFKTVAAKYSLQDQKKLFYATAMRIYKASRDPSAL